MHVFQVLFNNEIQLITHKGCTIAQTESSVIARLRHRSLDGGLSEADFLWGMTHMNAQKFY